MCIPIFFFLCDPSALGEAVTLLLELRLGGERRCKVSSVGEREGSTLGWGSSWLCFQLFLAFMHLALVEFIDPPIAWSKDPGLQASRYPPRNSPAPSPISLAIFFAWQHSVIRTEPRVSPWCQKLWVCIPPGWGGSAISVVSADCCNHWVWSFQMYFVWMQLAGCQWQESQWLAQALAGNHSECWLLVSLWIQCASIHFSPIFLLYPRNIPLLFKWCSHCLPNTQPIKKFSLHSPAISFVSQRVLTSTQPVWLYHLISAICLCGGNNLEAQISKPSCSTLCSQGILPWALLLLEVAGELWFVMSARVRFAQSLPPLRSCIAAGFLWIPNAAVSL